MRIAHMSRPLAGRRVNAHKKAVLFMAAWPAGFVGNMELLSMIHDQCIDTSTEICVDCKTHPTNTMGAIVQPLELILSV